MWGAPPAALAVLRRNVCSAAGSLAPTAQSFQLGRERGRGRKVSCSVLRDVLVSDCLLEPDRMCCVLRSETTDPLFHFSGTFSLMSLLGTSRKESLSSLVIPEVRLQEEHFTANSTFADFFPPGFERRLMK